MNPSAATLLARFEEKYVPEPNSGCWIWVSAVDARGYGRIFAFGRNSKATHVSWCLFRSEPIASKFLCHKCDNPSCVNPDHLFLGTPKDNAADMARKGRVRHAKLTASNIPEIVSRSKRGEKHTEIAASYGVSEKAIRQVLTGEAWSHALS